MQSGEVIFRQYLEDAVPRRRSETREAWFIRVSRLSGVRAARLKSLFYDTGCSLRASEWESLKTLTPRKMALTTEQQQLLDQIIQKHGEINDAMDKLFAEMAIYEAGNNRRDSVRHYRGRLV